MSNPVYARIFGVVVTGIGLFLAYSSIYQPMAAAESGAESIEYSTSFVGAAVVATAVGLIFAIFGSTGRTLLPQKGESPTALQGVVLVIVVALALVTVVAFERYLEQLGYS